MNEIRKDIAGYENYYQVSNLGRIKSLDRKIISHRKTKLVDIVKKGHVSKLHKETNGYLRIQLYKNNKYKYYYVHRLVASAFIRNPNNCEEVNHINGIKTDNRVENLERCTSKQNKIHGHKMHLYHNERPIVQIKDGVVIAEYSSITECAKKNGFVDVNIKRVLSNQRKNAYGYQWRYKD